MGNEGKAAFVTGASQSICTGLIQHYRPRNYHELGTARSIEDTVSETLAPFGRSATLVDNAGSFFARPLTQVTETATVGVSEEEAGRPYSRFQYMARSSLGLSRQRRALLSCLLGSGLAEDLSIPAVLRPLWTNDAMYRAYEIVRLIAALDAASPIGSAPQTTFSVESRLAAELALTYRQLSTHDAQEYIPCSGPLRTVVRDVVELFGMPFGAPELRTDIQGLTMPAFQGRALVLVASGLVMSALTKTFAPIRQIEVELTPLGFGVMRLRTVVISKTCADAGYTQNLQDLVSLLDEGCLHVFAAGRRHEIEVYFRPNRYRPAVLPRCYRAAPLA